MRLKRLTCRGFKSFADRTEFDFDASLTGIVGPNGCGKSNVVDALKWVLGDQRARSLRGQEMTDVIFKGAEGRDAMARADVEIVLEDEAGLLDGRTEVRIGRRLNREKESEYLINGDVVRLKDVRTAMMDTGLGVGAYSVMEQGRIDALLSANPQDRRAIFEEAAGISKFKAQKREALRKLDRTEQNLARVTDLVEERGRRIRSLKIQASRARRYGELRDQLRDYKASVAVFESREVRRDQEEREFELAEKQRGLRDIEERHRVAQQRLAEIEERMRADAAVLEELQTRMQRLEGQVGAAQSRAEGLQERCAERRADAENSHARGGSLKEQQSERRGRVDEARRRLEVLQADEASLSQEVEVQRAALADRQKEIDDLVTQRDRARERVLHWLHLRTQSRNFAHEQEARLRSADAAEARTGERLQTLKAELAELVAEEERQQAAHGQAEAEVERLREQEQQVHADLERADTETAEFARSESSLRERVSSVSGRMQVLSEMELHMEGLDQGPRHLLQQMPDGLRGRLLDLLDVDLEFGPAVEAALGPLVQALVVDTRERAEGMLTELAAGQHGRAALLVEEEFAAGATNVDLAPLPDGLEPLSTKVRCPSQARGLVDWLLRGVCLVESEAGILRDRPDLCFVTRAGQVFWGPRVEGGDGEGQGGLVVRKAQMHRLRQDKEALREKLSDLLRGKRAVEGRVEGLKEQAHDLSVQLQTLRGQAQTTLGELRRVAGRREDLSRERQVLELESREARQQGTAARARLGRHLLNDFLMQRLEQRETAAEEAATETLTAAQQRIQSARDAEQEVRLKQVACASDREALTGTLRAHEQNLQDIDQAIAELSERASAAQAAADLAAVEADRCVEEAQSLGRELAEAQAEHGRGVEAMAGAEEERGEKRSALQDYEGQRSAIGEEITALRLALSELEHQFARIDDRLREETSVELMRCLGEVEGLGLVARELPGPIAPDAAVLVLQGPPLPPDAVRAQTALSRLWERPDFDPDEARRLAQVLQSKVDRLGHVNLDAVRELDEMQSSYAFLVQEVSDLKDSRKSLMETLRRLEVESRSLFEDTFETSRKNFHLIFRKLFRGGKADMFLTSGEDSLEAGIEIIARPPGKELQSINLLSGGERSLTALAILFAVFQVKPSPFCILDEVDAALDDTNVERFLGVLREFVGPTQFCIVTHHKRTMAECAKLYGITMQRRGVSSRIAVSLDEVDRVTGAGMGEIDVHDRGVTNVSSAGSVEAALEQA